MKLSGDRLSGLLRDSGRTNHCFSRGARIPGRFVNVQSGGKAYTVIVDYSHTPDSLENCLKTARTFARGRVIAVFGCGGDRDRTKRPLMGEIAGRQADVCIVTSDNPRSENPESIIDEIMPGLEKTIGGKQYFRLADRKEANFKANSESKAQEDLTIISGVRAMKVIRLSVRR